MIIRVLVGFYIDLNLANAFDAIFIKKAIESVLMQSFKDFELLISDDGSTDRPLDICKDYADKDSRIKFFRHFSILATIF